MAEKEIRANNEEDEEKWFKHYCSSHQILLVGEGDFSFSLSLALAFGSASNILATSLDSCDMVTKKYKLAKSNLEKLHSLGASVLHGLDATRMKLYPDLRMRKFDRIIFNFPHAGFHGKEDDRQVIRMHMSLLDGFFGNANGMLRPNGEIHVNHKIKPPFNDWKLEELAFKNSLALIERVDFNIEDYPGYNNKRGDGNRCDEPFLLGKCNTFKFRFSRKANKMANASQSRSQLPQEAPPPQWPLFMNNQRLQAHPPPGYANCIPFETGMPPRDGARDECSRIFQEYFDNIRITYGRMDPYLFDSVNGALRTGYDRYMSEEPGRSVTGYLALLEELRSFSVFRSACLRRMLDLEGPMIHGGGI